MMRITKSINEMLDNYRTVFLMLCTYNGRVCALVSNLRWYYEMLWEFCDKVTDDDIIEVLKLGIEIEKSEDRVLNKYEIALTKLKEDERVINE